MLRGTASSRSIFSRRSLNIVRRTTMAPLSTSSSCQGPNHETPPVLFNVENTSRIVTLHRPNKLNALNTQMCQMLFKTLNEYSKSNLINLVIFKSSNGKRSFCAGGDVASVAEYNLSKEYNKSIKFFQDEYSLNFQMATFNKPIISIMDGITMGGGVGLSVHTPFRIATDSTKWAMPEMDIGFFPDVGVTFALPRVITMANLKSQMALYLCLTGDVLSGEDAYLLGLGSHYVTHENLVNLEKRLSEINQADIFLPKGDDMQFTDKSASLLNMIDSAIKEFSSALPKDHVFKYTDEQLNVIETCFDISKLQSVNDLLKSLDNFKGPVNAQNFALQIKDRLTKKSFTSMNIAIRLLQDNSKDHIESSLRRDLYTAANMCHNNVDGLSEFSEATHHKLILKEKTPYNWKNNEKNILSTQITSLTSPKPTIPLSLLKNNSNITWKEYPHHAKYQLPTEKMVKELIQKNTFTKEGLLDYFANENASTKDKTSIKYICHNIIRRKCQVGKETSTLKWLD